MTPQAGVSSNGPRPRPHYRRPHVYATSVADPPRWPRPVLLRSSFGYLMGVGLVWRRQRYLAWRGFGGPAPRGCHRAAFGWCCSRPPHDGPCAARPRWWNLIGRIAR